MLCFNIPSVVLQVYNENTLSKLYKTIICLFQKTGIKNMESNGKINFKVED